MAPTTPQGQDDSAHYLTRPIRRRLRNNNPYDTSHVPPSSSSPANIADVTPGTGGLGRGGGGRGGGDGRLPGLNLGARRIQEFRTPVDLNSDVPSSAYSAYTRSHSRPRAGLGAGVGASREVEEEEDEEVELNMDHDLDADLEDGDDELHGDEGDLTSSVRDGHDGDGLDEGQMELDREVEVPFDTTGLKEIGNLASWTVSSFKPGCGVEALRDEDTNLFWQSDGPQPHSLSIHFSRLVSILYIRIYLDFDADESYTPTKIALLAGTGYHDLIPFRSLELSQPRGWTDVPLDGVGGRDPHDPANHSSATDHLDEGRETGGDVLRAFLVQIRIIENHQNGKDTHLRGVRVYGRDERAGILSRAVPTFEESHETSVKDESAARLVEPDWMGEWELR